MPTKRQARAVIIIVSLFLIGPVPILKHAARRHATEDQSGSVGWKVGRAAAGSL
jgi:hypothetical protein